MYWEQRLFVGSAISQEKLEGLKAPKSINTVYDIDFLQAIEASGDGVIDLGPVYFIRPVGVVALLATLERLTKQLGIEKVTLKLPENPKVREYLRLSGVFDVMRDFISINDPQPEDMIPERPSERPMVSCSRFDTEHNVDQLANQMEECFETKPVYGSILATCHTAFSELASNVVSHAESNGGYVLAQQYNYRSGSKVEIAVADCGIGIQASLQKNHKHTPMLLDVDAIEKAIEEGVSSLEDNSRGYGLYHVTDDVKKNNDREMTIRSGYGTMRLQGSGDIRKTNDLFIYSGTIVSVIIPC